MTSTALDLGRCYARHWTTLENSQRPVPLSALASLREDRQKNYKDIAKEYALPSPLTPTNPQQEIVIPPLTDLLSYYNLTTPNIEFGWNPRFHFCPFHDPYESLDTALKTHEHVLALAMGLKPSMRGLDAGCGIGAPARDLVRFADVHITGVSINECHVERAREVAEKEGLGGRCEFVEGDFMDMSMFADETFDFAYAIEATVYAPDLARCYSEIARVLKPGGVFGVYEWLTTDRFNEQSREHVEVRQRLERGDGITNIVGVREGLAAMRSAGLELERHEDRAESGLEDKKWWYCINGEVGKTTCDEDWWTVFRLRQGVWTVQCMIVWMLEGLSLVERGRYEALRTQGQSVWGLRDGGRLGIFSPMYMMVGRKPLDGHKSKA